MNHGKSWRDCLTKSTRFISYICLGREKDLLNVYPEHQWTQLHKMQWFISAGGKNMYSMWRPCNLTAFIHSLTGPVGQPFASRHEGPRFNPRGVLLWNWDSPVSFVSLQVTRILHVRIWSSWCVLSSFKTKKQRKGGALLHIITSKWLIVYSFSLCQCLDLAVAPCMKRSHRAGLPPWLLKISQL